MKRPWSMALALFMAVMFLLAPGAAGAGGGGQDPMIVAAGDIACKNPPANNPLKCQYDDVAALVAEGHYDAFLALGDIQYETGLYQDFLDNYNAHFAPLLPITYPVPGNHDYGTPGAQGYFQYFGPIAHGPGGYYSFDLSTWHVIALNSATCDPFGGAPCGPGTPEYEWLKADLTAHPNGSYPCTLAFWHQPRFDWLKYQNASWLDQFDLQRSAPLWDLLYAAGADVVLAGHNHNYQRRAPQDPNGAYDPARGIVQFVVGTGGRSLNGLGHKPRPANFVTGQTRSFGVLQMTLHPGSYEYRWVSAPGQPPFADAGTGYCH